MARGPIEGPRGAAPQLLQGHTGARKTFRWAAGCFGLARCTRRERGRRPWSFRSFEGAETVEFRRRNPGLRQKSDTAGGWLMKPDEPRTAARSCYGKRPAGFRAGLSLAANCAAGMQMVFREKATPRSKSAASRSRIRDSPWAEGFMAGGPRGARNRGARMLGKVG